MKKENVLYVDWESGLQSCPGIDWEPLCQTACVHSFNQSTDRSSVDWAQGYTSKTEYRESLREPSFFPASEAWPRQEQKSCF